MRFVTGFCYRSLLHAVCHKDGQQALSGQAAGFGEEVFDFVVFTGGIAGVAAVVRIPAGETCAVVDQLLAGQAGIQLVADDPGDYAGDIAGSASGGDIAAALLFGKPLVVATRWVVSVQPVGGIQGRGNLGGVDAMCAE